MSLLTDSGPTPEAAAAKQIRQAIRSSALNDVDQIRQIQTQIWKLDGVDPQDVFDEFGTLAGAMLDARDALVAKVSAIAVDNGQVLADYIDSSWYDNTVGGHTATVNMDGTVTVS